MARSHHDPHVLCRITGKSCREADAILFSAVRPNLARVLLERMPGLQPDDHISREVLDDAMADYVRSLLAMQLGELTQLEEDVVRSLRSQELLAENPDEDNRAPLTFGQRLADGLASFGGSWRFIIFFSLVLAAWIGSNIFLWHNRGFDPYPFILLNLVLSCLAALQAPVIMMSQNRQEERDRFRAQNDYKVNLKAELEIRHLHEKMDYLLKKNSERMIEIQQIQIDLMREIARMRR
ncbi:MAG: DUF1003 domain-containing protein [Verrucomicrobiales bacterium]|nr:DUF1003 domain-containing protein [Verrucomicrobiales bacterium]